MSNIDTSRLAAILNAAQSPVLKKLLDDKARIQKSIEEAQAQLTEVESKLAATIPPELRALLSPPEPSKPRTPRAKVENSDLKKPDLQQLKEILNNLPGKTLSIRSEGYETRNIKILAEANPHLFAYEKGTWPKVTYLR